MARVATKAGGTITQEPEGTAPPEQTITLPFVIKNLDPDVEKPLAEEEPKTKNVTDEQIEEFVQTKVGNKFAASTTFEIKMPTPTVNATSESVTWTAASDPYAAQPSKWTFSSTSSMPSLVKKKSCWGCGKEGGNCETTCNNCGNCDPKDCSCVQCKYKNEWDDEQCAVKMHKDDACEMCGMCGTHCEHTWCENCEEHVSTDDFCTICDWCHDCCTHDKDENGNPIIPPKVELLTKPPWEARGIIITRSEIVAMRNEIKKLGVNRFGEPLTGSPSGEDAWKLFWNIQNKAIDPVRAMADYYLLDGIAGMVFNGCREVRADAICRALAAEAAEGHRLLVDWLDPSFCEYVDMACGGELRYHEAIGEKVIGGPRWTAWTEWRMLRNKVGVDALKDAADLFESMQGNVSKGIGGPKWAAGARLLHGRLTGKIDPHTFVDRVFTLQHNGGSFINKIGWAVTTPGLWQHDSMTLLLGPAHSENPTRFSPLLCAASSRVASLFVEWWRATNMVRSMHGMEATKIPTIFDDINHHRDKDGRLPQDHAQLSYMGDRHSQFWFPNPLLSFSNEPGFGGKPDWLTTLDLAVIREINMWGMDAGFVPDPPYLKDRLRKFLEMLPTKNPDPATPVPITSQALIVAVTLWKMWAPSLAADRRMMYGLAREARAFLYRLSGDHRYKASYEAFQNQKEKAGSIDTEPDMEKESFDELGWQSLWTLSKSAITFNPEGEAHGADTAT